MHLSLNHHAATSLCRHRYNDGCWFDRHTVCVSVMRTPIFTTRILTTPIFLFYHGRCAMSVPLCSMSHIPPHLTRAHSSSHALAVFIHRASYIPATLALSCQLSHRGRQHILRVRLHAAMMQGVRVHVAATLVGGRATCERVGT